MTKKRNTTSRLNKVDYFIFIICSILSACMFYLYYMNMNSFSIKLDEDPIAEIGVKENVVQRKFADRNLWEKVGLSSSIYEGDIIRTAGDSRASVIFLQRQTNVSLNENSMIQISQSKNRDSINFITGEIQLKNNSKDKSLVIQAGVKEISLADSAEVNIHVEPFMEGEEQAKDAVIDVVSGQVELSDIKEFSKFKKDVEKSIIKAGETATFKLIENSKEEIQKLTQPVEEGAEQAQPEEEVEIVSNIELGIEGEKQEKYINFEYNVWDEENGRYNYSAGLWLSELLTEHKRIPKGTAIEVTISGIPETRLDGLAFQVGTGERVWLEADVFRWDGFGDTNGLAPGQRFERKRIMIIQNEIKSTSKAWLHFTYEATFMDKESTVKEFTVKAKVLDKNAFAKITPVQPGVSKSYEFDNYQFIRNPYQFDSYINAEKIFGDYKSIPAGTKIRVSVQGIPDRDMPWFIPLLIDQTDGPWENLLSAENEDLKPQDQEYLKKGKLFKTEKVYVVKRGMVVTNNGMFQMVSEKKGEGRLEIKNFKLKIEVIE